MTVLQMDAAAVRAALDWPSLIDALDAMFRDGCEAPTRHHHEVARDGQPDATLLLMPAWGKGAGAIGVKLVTVFPGNADRGLPAIAGSYVIFDGETGALKAVLDGGELTARRTAAASALAARYLAKPDASTLAIIGTGRLAPNLAGAHAAIRPIERVLVWGRSPDKALATAKAITAETGLAAAPADIAQAVGEADIVSAATLSTAPLIKGADLKPGAHVDLVGAFKPTMRETDDAVMSRADAVYVDTFDGALSEGGDIVQAMSSGALDRAKIRAELAQLARGEIVAERGPEAITVFKSVGAALEDLAAAQLCVVRASALG